MSINIQSSQMNLAGMGQVSGIRGQRGQCQGTEEDSNRSERREPPPGGGMAGDISQILQQMGVQMPGTVSATSATDTGNTTANSISVSSTQGAGQMQRMGPPPPPPGGMGGASSEVQDAMHTLMHDIMDAVKQSSSEVSEDGTTTSTETGYDSFESKLSQVLQSISGGENTELADKLTADLDKLVAAMGAQASDGTTSEDGSEATSSVNLQDFLSALVDKAQTHAQEGKGRHMQGMGDLFQAQV